MAFSRSQITHRVYVCESAIYTESALWQIGRARSPLLEMEDVGPICARALLHNDEQ